MTNGTDFLRCGDFCSFQGFSIFSRAQKSFFFQIFSQGFTTSKEIEEMMEDEVLLRMRELKACDDPDAFTDAENTALRVIPSIGSAFSSRSDLYHIYLFLHSETSTYSV